MPLIRSRDDWQRRLVEAASRPHANESDLRHAVFLVLHEYAIHVVGIEEGSIRHEGTSTGGRFDSIYGNTLIEYKTPGELSTLSKKRKHAGQALRYLRDEQIGAEVVILTDGLEWGILRDKSDDAEQQVLFGGDEDLQPEEHFQWRSNSTAAAARVLDLLDTHRYDPVTPVSLMNKLGPTTSAGRELLAALGASLTNRRDGGRTDILFRQWIALAGVSYGISRDHSEWPVDRRAILGPLERTLPVQGYAETIYLLHTYVAICSKMMAAEALALTRGEADYRPSQWPSFERGGFVRQVQELESGSLASELRAPQLMGGDLFGWYADELDDESLADAVRAMYVSFAELAWARLTHATRVTGDLLRDFYMGVVPRGLRKALGEFFTPQWLADRVVEKAFELSGFDPSDKVRYLDPTCGSGTFLVAAMNRALLSAKRRHLSDSEALSEALDSVTGFDVNPVSPLMARVNLLLTVGDLADAIPTIQFNVFQADSILIPEEIAGEVRFDQANSDVSVPLVVGDISLPESLATMRGITALARVLDTSIQRGRSAEVFAKRLSAEFPVMGVAETEAEVALAAAITVFDMLKSLHEDDLDGVWAHVIEQSFAPRVLKPVDIVIGNPPWISWKNLPQVWRERSEATWSRWGLWQTKARGGGTPMGDISSLLLARAIATYAPNGLVALLLPEGILVNEPGGRAIRQCKLRDTSGEVIRWFRPLHVDDFTTLRPFADAANRTIALYVRAGEEPAFPISQDLWSRAQPRTKIPAEAAFRAVRPLLRAESSTLAPIDAGDVASRWREPGRALLTPNKTSGRYVWGQGFHTRGADGIFYCQVVSHAPLAGGLVRIRTRPDLGRNTAKGIQSHEYVVEARYLWPLLRGADVQPFAVTPSDLYCIVPHDPNRLTEILSADRLMRDAPNLFDYLEIHQDRLLNRSAYDMRLTTEKPWGIQGQAWKHMSRETVYVASRYMAPDKHPLACVVQPEIDARLGITTVRYPNNKVNFVACSSTAEADFVAAFVNAPSVQAEIARLVSNTTIGPSVLTGLPIPKYEAQNDSHLALRQLGQECRIEPHGWEALGDVADELVANLAD